jgi:hypothetical protein
MAGKLFDEDTSDIQTKVMDHRGGTDWGGIVLLITLLGFYVVSIVLRAVLSSHSDPDIWFIPLLVGVSVLAFTCLLLAFYWIRGQLRARDVRRLLPNAVLFEVVMTVELAVEVRTAETALGEAAPQIWPQTYLTGAVTRDALWFFGGSFRAIQRARIPADKIHSVTVRTIAFPTRALTRHFPALAIGVEPGDQKLEVLPLRTTFMVPRKLKPDQLAAASRDIAETVGIDLSIEGVPMKSPRRATGS